METNLKQRLRFELAGLVSKDLEQQAVGGVKLVLHELRNGQVKGALQELLTGLDTCPRNAVKLRLQLAEYCILKCTSKAQLPGLLSFLNKQANTVLAKNRNDGACISSLAALMSSCLAKLLHQPAGGSYAASMHGPTARAQTADGLCEALLFPALKSTYKDPEQSRVAAGSVVLLAMLEVMKAYAEMPEVVEAVRRCLALMVQLLANGNLVQRVPGALLPCSACLDVLGATIDKDCAKRLLLLCLKGAAVKDVWQVRRDSLQTLAVLAASLLGLSGGDDAATVAAQQGQLLLTTPALRVLIARKAEVVQLLENARYDKIAAVRVAAAAALAKFMLLPDAPKAPEPAPAETPEMKAADAGFVRRTSRSASKSNNGASAGRKSNKRLSGAAAMASGTKQTHAYSAGPARPGPSRFTRPRLPPGAVMDYGVQVFAPPSPPRRPADQSPAGGGDAVQGADQSPVRRQLEFGGPKQATTPGRTPDSVDVSSQTCQVCGPAPQYTVQSPLGAAYAAMQQQQQQQPCGLGAATPSSPLSPAAGHYFPSDALQMLDQNQQQLGLPGMLAGMHSPRLDVSHHVHGRVELGITYSPIGSPLRGDAAAAAAAAAAGSNNSAPGTQQCSPAGDPAAGLFGSLIPGMQHGWWPAQRQQQQQEAGLQHQVHTVRAAAVDGQHEPSHMPSAAGEPSFAVMPEEYANGTAADAADSNVLYDGAGTWPAAGMAADAAAASSPSAGAEYDYPAIFGTYVVTGDEPSAAAAAAAAAAVEGSATDTGQEGALQQCNSSDSSDAFLEEQRSRRARQRWQVPGVLAASMDGAIGKTGAAGVATSTADHVDGAEQPGVVVDRFSRSLPTSRCSSRQYERGLSRSSSKSGVGPGSSLDVLRNVGARVQGLLEALSRQTSSSERQQRQSQDSADAVDDAGDAIDGSAESSGEAANVPITAATGPFATAAAAAAGAINTAGTNAGQGSPLLSPALQRRQALLQEMQQQEDAVHNRIQASRAESMKLLASLQQLSAAHEQQEQKEDGQEAGEQQQQQQGPLDLKIHASRAESYQLLASLQFLSSDASTEALQAGGQSLAALAARQQVGAAIKSQPNSPAPSGQQQQQQAPWEQGDAGIPSASVSMQFNELFQSSGLEGAAGTAAAAAAHQTGTSAADELQRRGRSSPGGNATASGGSGGLAQVERALQKLQTLRNTLQSIGNSAASSRLVSGRDSGVPSAAGSMPVSAEVSSSHVPAAGSGSTLLMQQSSTAPAPTTPVVAATGPSQAGASSDGQQQPQPGTEECLEQQQPVYQLQEQKQEQQQQQQEPGALAASTREWIRQISEKLQQAGTSDTLCAAAAELEQAAAAAAAQAGSEDPPAQLCYQIAVAPGPLALHVTCSNASSPQQQKALFGPSVAAAFGTQLTGSSNATAAASSSSKLADCDDATVHNAELLAPQGIGPEVQLSGLQSGSQAGSCGSPGWSLLAAQSGSGLVEQLAGDSSVSGSVHHCEQQQQQQQQWKSPGCVASTGDYGHAEHVWEEEVQQQGQATGLNTHDVLSASRSQKHGVSWAAAGSPPVLQAELAAVPVAGRLHQMLDDSDDTALLMSLAMKLNMLAKKFGGQSAGVTSGGGGSIGVAHLPGTPDAAARLLGNSLGSLGSFGGSPAHWTSVTHNHLYVSSPVKAATAGEAAASVWQQQQQPEVEEAALPRQLASHDATYAAWAEDGLTADAAHAGADTAMPPGGTYPQHMQPPEPWLEVQDAALQQVLGVSLRELQEGGSQVESKVLEAVVHLQQQLDLFTEQPIAATSQMLDIAGINLCSLMQLMPHSPASTSRRTTAVERWQMGSPSACNKPRQVEKQVRPLIVLLMHAYEQAVHEQCRGHMLHHMLSEGGTMEPGPQQPEPQQQQQQQQHRCSWEAAAKAAAEQQVQWFVREQLSHLVQLMGSITRRGFAA